MWPSSSRLISSIEIISLETWWSSPCSTQDGEHQISRFLGSTAFKIRASLNHSSAISTSLDSSSHEHIPWRSLSSWHFPAPNKRVLWPIYYIWLSLTPVWFYWWHSPGYTQEKEKNENKQTNKKKKRTKKGTSLKIILPGSAVPDLKRSSLTFNKISHEKHCIPL